MTMKIAIVAAETVVALATTVVTTPCGAGAVRMRDRSDRDLLVFAPSPGDFFPTLAFHLIPEFNTHFHLRSVK